MSETPSIGNVNRTSCLNVLPLRCIDNEFLTTHSGANDVRQNESMDIKQEIFLGLGLFYRYETDSAPQPPRSYPSTRWEIVPRTLGQR